MWNSRHFLRFTLWLTLLVPVIITPALAQKPRLWIGTITDGPWDRDQMILATFENEIRASVGNSHDVEFPDEKQLNGDWTSNGVKLALNELLADPEVDVIITLGLVSSYEAVKMKTLAKPVIATQVVAPEFLEVPSKQVDLEYVSGISNLSYITVRGLDLVQKMGIFREIVPYSRLTFLFMESLESLFPTLEAEIRRELAPLADVDVILVGDSLGSALAALSPTVEAVILTPLPQLTPADYGRLLNILRDMRLPTFTLGNRSDIALGVMAGVISAEQTDLLARRTASNIREILDGKNAGNLPVDLPVDESLIINIEVAAAVGIPFDQGPGAEAQKAKMAQSAKASASMSAITDEEAPQLQLSPDKTEETRQLEERLIREVQRRIVRLSSLTAFDGISFSVAGSKVTLLGHAWRPALKNDAERAVSQIEGAEVESRIEVLPTSSFDDDIRARAYVDIYGHSSLGRYSPGAGFSGFDRQRLFSDLTRFGLESAQQVQGVHPIHIIVKNGNVALVGMVNNNLDRQIAKTQVQTLSGVFSVENHLQTHTRN